MKVTGPDANLGQNVGPADDATGPSPTGKAGATATAERPEGSGAAFEARRADAAPPAAATTAQVGATGGASPIATADLAAAVRAGHLDPRAALDQVIERVLDRQLGAGAPAATRERVRAALQEALQDDPLLAEKQRRLG